MPSPGAWREVPCAKCGRRVPGLAWGDLCPECRWEREGRARRLSQWVAMAATALMALYVALRLPPEPMPRLYAAIAVVVTYIVVRRIVTRLAMEFLPK
jgi:hypothetical protein